MISKIKNVIRRYKLSKRQKWFLKHYVRSNDDVTILSSNCLGGFIYHDINSKFYSPTINLTFDPEDFIYFVNHINDISNCSLDEDKTNNSKFPVGLLKYPDNKCIKIYFVHYNSFKDAKNVFFTRSKRITNNIFVLLTVNHLTKEICDYFSDLKYKKICFYNTIEKNVDINSNIFFNAHKAFLNKKDAMSFKPLLSRKLIFDDVDFDYYSFIGMIKK